MIQYLCTCQALCNSCLDLRSKKSPHHTVKRSSLTAWLAFAEDSVPISSKAKTALKKDPENTNVFLTCELMTERQNVEHFMLPAENEYSAKELSIKGSAPRSHDDKKHWTEAQVSAQLTGDPSFGFVVIDGLRKGTSLGQKNMLIVYNRYPYHGNVEWAIFQMQTRPDYKGPMMASLSISPDVKAVNFAKQQVHQNLYKACFRSIVM